MEANVDLLRFRFLQHPFADGMPPYPSAGDAVMQTAIRPIAHAVEHHFDSDLVGLHYWLASISQVRGAVARSRHPPVVRAVSLHSAFFRGEIIPTHLALMQAAFTVRTHLLARAWASWLGAVKLIQRIRMHNRLVFCLPLPEAPLAKIADCLLPANATSAQLRSIVDVIVRTAAGRVVGPFPCIVTVHMSLSQWGIDPHDQTDRMSLAYARILLSWLRRRLL